MNPDETIHTESVSKEQDAGHVPAEAMLYCPVCDSKLIERKCKLLCPQCGYYMSCADYY